MLLYDELTCEEFNWLFNKFKEGTGLKNLSFVKSHFTKDKFDYYLLFCEGFEERSMISDWNHEDEITWARQMIPYLEESWSELQVLPVQWFKRTLREYVDCYYTTN